MYFIWYPLLCRLDEKKMLIRAREQDRDKIFDKLIENRETVEKLVDAQPDALQEHQFYQEMIAYIRDLLDCLNEKVGLGLSVYK